MDLLELGVIVAVIAVVLYWVVVLPAREKRKRERERMNQTHSGPRQPWDPNLDKGRRNR
jgi:preprotein translocase subunit YajC